MTPRISVAAPLPASITNRFARPAAGAILVAALIAAGATAVWAGRGVPALTGRIVDTAGLLSAGTAAALDKDLAALEFSDSTQVVVLTIPSLEGEDLEGFSIKVVEAWKLGQAKKDNGVLLLVAQRERKIRIEVGRGIEGKLTDLVSGRIIRNEIAPHFKQGDFDGGIAAGVGAIIKVVRGEYKGAAGDRGEGRRGGPGPGILLFILGIFILMAKGGVLLGGLGGGVGLPLGVGLMSGGLPFPGVLGLGLGGLIMGMLTGAIMRATRGWGRYSGGGNGGFFMGGGGGGGGGGSFGGFSGGGGSFGGGGASGGW